MMVALVAAGCGGSESTNDASVDLAPDLHVVYDFTINCGPQSGQCTWMFGAPPASCTPPDSCQACSVSYNRYCTCMAPENVWNCCVPNGPFVNFCPSGAPPTEGAICCPNVPVSDCIYPGATCTCISQRWSCTLADGGAHD
jgi:hypothetical protein